MIDTSNIISLVLFGLLFVFGVTGNILIILFFKFKDKTTKPNYRILIIVLALVDLISSIYNSVFYGIPFQLDSVTPWYFGEFLCRYSGVISQTLSVSSSNILCLMVGLRYRQLANTFSQPFKERYIYLASLLCILVTLTTSFLIQEQKVLKNGECVWMFENNVQTYDRDQTALSILLSDILLIIVPLLIILILTYKTSRLIRRRNFLNLGRPQWIRNRKTDKLIWLTVKVYFGIVLLPAIYSVILSSMFWASNSVIDDNFQTMWDISFYFYLLTLSNSIANGFLYAGRVKEFRLFVKRLFIK